MRRIALTLVAALIAASTMATAAFAEHRWRGGYYRSYQPAHVRVHRVHRGWAQSPDVYGGGYRRAAIYGWTPYRRAYRPWAWGAGAAIAAGALYGTASAYWRYGGPAHYPGYFGYYGHPGYYAYPSYSAYRAYESVVLGYPAVGYAYAPGWYGHSGCWRPTFVYAGYFGCGYRTYYRSCAWASCL